MMKLQLSQGPRKFSIEKGVGWQPCPVSPASPDTEGSLLGACLVFIGLIDEDTVLTNANLLCIWAGFS